jgi:pimeloyl-ACP methyl ester carboxylesterase
MHPVDLRKNVVPLNEHLISTFTDIIPETTGYKAEKKVLHVHSIETTQMEKGDEKDVIVFLHQFGSGAFTWQQVMSLLASDKTNGLLAFDRVAHGMTFPDPNPIVDHSEDATPHGEDLSKVLHFSDSIQTEDFDVSLINELAGNKRIMIVTCGGAGARLALLFMQRFPDRVCGLVLISPYGINTGNGVPTILKSVASASVGRALIVSMARSEILQVIPHRGWHSPTIPENVLETYARSVEVPGWEDCMLGYLQRPTSEVNVSIPNEIPCLIVEGEYDRCRESTQEYMELKSRMGDHVQITIIPEVGAWPQEEKPDVVAQIIKQFMTSIR